VYDRAVTELDDLPTRRASNCMDCVNPQTPYAVWSSHAVLSSWKEGSRVTLLQESTTF
jgi:hypothetical protein